MRPYEASFGRVLSHELTTVHVETERTPLNASSVAAMHWPIAQPTVLNTLEEMYRDRHVVLTNQTHGTTIAKVDRDSAAIAFDADGLITNDPTVLIAGVGADCPLVLASDGTIQGIAHSGWRGTLDGIAPQLITLMLEQGADPKLVRVHISPAIQDCCYQIDVSTDPQHRIRQFLATFGSSVLRERDAGIFLSLSDAIRISLLQEGIQPNAVSVDGRCTCCSPRQFPSHRRQLVTRTTTMVGAVYRKRFLNEASLQADQPRTEPLTPLQPLDHE